MKIDSAVPNSSTTSFFPRRLQSAFARATKLPQYSSNRVANVCENLTLEKALADIPEPGNHSETAAMANRMSASVEFSVVVPAFNSAAFIAATLKSALRQTHPPAEVIVVNDGSTDETVEIVQGFGDKVRLLSQPNQGVSAARNFGIQNARSEWIALLDSDDLWRADKLELQARAILENPGADFVYTSSYTFSENWLEKLVPAPPVSRIKQELEGWIPFSVSTVVFRRSKALEIGGFDPAMRLAEEWDMWLRFIQAGTEFAAVEECVAFYRRSPQSLSHQAKAYLKFQKIVVKKHIARGEPAIQRWLKHHRLISRLEAEAAIMLREIGSAEQLKFMRSSLFRFPFPLSLSDRRYKIAAHMLLTRIGFIRSNPVR
jgi:glycosyltransferase involved in cell wall biosynthesis